MGDGAKRASTSDGAPRALAWGGAALVALGLVLLLIDVQRQVSTASGWIALVAGAIALALAGLLTQRPIAPPSSSRQRWISAAALGVLLVQALIPLGYYLGDDPYDERFSWRMFSAVRMHRCAVEADELREGQRVSIPLGDTLHVAWITTLRRNRAAATTRFLRWRCEGGAAEARVISRCVAPDGTRLAPLVTTIDCDAAEVRVTGGGE